MGTVPMPGHCGPARSYEWEGRGLLPPLQGVMGCSCPEAGERRATPTSASLLQEPGLGLGTDSAT